MATLTAESRVTPTTISSKIADVKYVYHDLMTICILDLENGFTVIGKSACASPAIYNKAMGEKLAYDDAFNNVWPLEGYLLKQRLYEVAQP